MFLKQVGYPIKSSLALDGINNKLCLHIWTNPQKAVHKQQQDCHHNHFHHTFSAE